MSIHRSVVDSRGHRMLLRLLAHGSAHKAVSNVTCRDRSKWKERLLVLVLLESVSTFRHLASVRLVCSRAHEMSLVHPSLRCSHVQEIVLSTTILEMSHARSQVWMHVWMHATPSCFWSNS